MYGAFCAGALVLAACGGGGGGGSDSPVATSPVPPSSLNQSAGDGSSAVGSTPVASAPVVTYGLTVSVTGSGTVTATGNSSSTSCSTSPCSVGPYPENTSVSLSATPSSGYQFTGWSGAGCSGTGNCTVAMSQAQSVTAAFTVSAPVVVTPPPVTYALNVAFSGSGSVVATAAGASTSCSATCSNTYPASTSVSLTATPASGFRFTGWTGGGCSTVATCTVSMASALNVTATFAPVYALNLTMAGQGSVAETSSGATVTCTATCSNAYLANASVTLTATPATGYTLTGWTGGGCSTASTCTVSMASAQNVTATFAVTSTALVAPTPMGPLFPTVQTSGVLPITVNCAADAAGTRKVAFGVPFPRGFLTSATKVRLETEQGVEVAADTAELARWRHMSDTSIDGQSIRSVLVTFNQACTNSGVFKYNIRWGTDKTLSANAGITAANVYTTWRAQAPVVTGENVATDNYSRDTAAATIYEPYAWVGLPAAWLMKSNLRGPVSPIVDNGTFAMKTWLINFNKTFVNDVASDVTVYEDEVAGNPGMIDWSKEVEGWLFDRPFALWNVYVQTGDPKWLRHAHRATQYYQSYITSVDLANGYKRGAFLKRAQNYAGDAGDVKYSQAGGMFAAYLLTGDGRLIDKIKAVTNLVDYEVSFRLLPYAQTSGLYTERQLATGLAAYTYAYEATGDSTYKTKLKAAVDGMWTDVTAPPAGYPAVSDMAGVLLHRPEVHEGDSQKNGDMIMSPWMSALMCDVLMHYYLLSDDVHALNFMNSYAMFVVNKGLYNATTDVGYYVPWYIAGFKAGYTDSGSWADIEHTPDVLGLLARGRWARTKLGLATDANLETAITRMRTASIFDFGDAIRSTAGYPRYRAAPTRRANWWLGTNESLSFFNVQ
jgi:hypothetical protein